MGTATYRVKPLEGLADAVAGWVWMTCWWDLGSKWDVPSRGAPEDAGNEQEHRMRQRLGLGRSRRGSWVRDRPQKPCEP